MDINLFFFFPYYFVSLMFVLLKKYYLVRGREGGKVPNDPSTENREKSFWTFDRFTKENNNNTFLSLRNFHCIDSSGRFYSFLYYNYTSVCVSTLEKSSLLHWMFQPFLRNRIAWGQSSLVWHFSRVIFLHFPSSFENLFQWRRFYKSQKKKKKMIIKRCLTVTLSRTCWPQ